MLACRFLFPRGLLFSGVLAALVTAGCGPHSFRLTETVTLRAQDGQYARLRVNNLVGGVRVVGDPSAKEVVAQVTKIGRGVSPGEAAKALREIEVALAPGKGSGGQLEAAATHPRQSGLRSWGVDWHITAPPELALAVTTGVGDIGAESLDQGASVSTGVGDVVLKNIRGDVVASSGVGSLRVEQLHGAAALDTGVGDIRLVQSSGSCGVRASTGVGSIRAMLPQYVEGRLTASTGVGSLNLDLGSIPLSHLRHSRQSVSVVLDGATEPELDFTVSVGDLTVTAR